VVQAPITAFVIVSEMTNDHAMVIPLMAAAVFGYAASRLVCHEGVYHALARNFLRTALDEGGKPARPPDGRSGPA
jgi:H+/Cl- antiporter ClcA